MQHACLVSCLTLAVGNHAAARLDEAQVVPAIHSSKVCRAQPGKLQCCMGTHRDKHLTGTYLQLHEQQQHISSVACCHLYSVIACCTLNQHVARGASKCVKRHSPCLETSWQRALKGSTAVLWARRPNLQILQHDSQSLPRAVPPQTLHRSLDILKPVGHWNLVGAASPLGPKSLASATHMQCSADGWKIQ